MAESRRIQSAWESPKRCLSTIGDKERPI